MTQRQGNEHPLALISGQTTHAESMRNRCAAKETSKRTIIFLIIRQLGRRLRSAFNTLKGRCLGITGVGTIMEGTSINRGYGRRVGRGHILIIGKEELLVRMAQSNINWLVQRVGCESCVCVVGRATSSRWDTRPARGQNTS